ncbi:hypothetical protein [Arthrobacter sp. SDTb3-6]|uniref:hypothetical protein n=1 Tax=Arthrobacter sp. SDTb3-6 TaxID=2713571 RepID=UPI00159DD711|nr:hypothetical protein [Arthrobacter sp. SDTb3-6]NVM98444.1 hypothetical protein [Arthrobacter sp. SDTb3-6]
MDAPASENSNDRHIDARALRFAMIFPVLLCLGLVGGGLLVAGRLPAGAVLPTGGGVLPLPAFLAVAVAVTLGLGAGIGFFGARTTLPRNLRRILLGTAMALQLASTTVFSAALLGQSGLGGAAPVRLDGYVVMMGCGLAAAMGVVLALTFKPDEQWTGADDEALAELLEIEADPTVANDRLVYAIHPRSSVVIMILLAGILPGGVLTVVSPWLLLALALAAGLVVALLSATVHVDRQRLVVKLAGVVPVIAMACTDVEAAVSLDIKARDYGGWGLRKHSGSESFLAFSGAAVVLRDVRGRVVLGAPNLDTADDLAAILNRRAGKRPGQH